MFARGGQRAQGGGESILSQISRSVRARGRSSCPDRSGRLAFSPRTSLRATEVDPPPHPPSAGRPFMPSLRRRRREVFSDVSGVAFGGVVDAICLRIGLPVAELSTAQRALPAVKRAGTAGAILGVICGCLLGMCSLLFLDLEVGPPCACRRLSRRFVAASAYRLVAVRAFRLLHHRTSSVSASASLSSLSSSVSNTCPASTPRDAFDSHLRRSTRCLFLGRLSMMAIAPPRLPCGLVANAPNTPTRWRRRRDLQSSRRRQRCSIDSGR